MAVTVAFSAIFLVSLAFCFFSAMEKKRGFEVKVEVEIEVEIEVERFLLSSK